MKKKLSVVLCILLGVILSCKKNQVANKPVFNPNTIDNMAANAKGCATGPVWQAWQKLPLDGSGYSHPSMVAIDNQHNVYTAGSGSGPIIFGDSTHSTTITGPATWLKKDNGDGTLAWVIKLSDKQISCTGILFDHSGNTYVTLKDIFEYSAEIFVLVKISNSGTVIWSVSQAFGGFVSGDEPIPTNAHARIGQNGEIIVYGYYFDWTPFIDVPKTDFDPGPGTKFLAHSTSFIERLGPDGQFIGIRPSKLGDSAVVFISDSGNVYRVRRLYGVVKVNGKNQGTARQYSYIIYKYDAEENFKWYAPIPAGNGGGGLTVTPDGATFVIQGDQLYKLNVNGKRAWQKTIAPYAHSMINDESGNLYILRQADKIDLDYDPGPGVYTIPLVYTEATTIQKLDESGNFVWAIKKEFSVARPFNLPVSLAINNIGQLALTGYYYKSDFDKANTFTVKYTQCNNGN